MRKKNRKLKEKNVRVLNKKLKEKRKIWKD